MRQRLMLLASFSAVLVFTALYFVVSAGATSANGFTATTLAKGTLAEFEVFNHAVLAGSTSKDDDDERRNVWMSLQKTKGSSDLYIQSNVWKPVDPITKAIASTGWHSHPGHSLIIVTEGAITDYESDDPACKPQVYTTGMSFVDSGGTHVHIIRNEGNVEAATIAVQLIPAGATRRIDAPTAPANCPGIQ